MSRPVDWAPLADADPVPGDVARIQLIGRRHADLGDELEAQANILRRLSEADGWDADAGRAFASTAREIGDALGKARRRYSAVVEALHGYAPELAQAQREADAALREAQAAQSSITANESTSQSSTDPSSPSSADEADEKARSSALDDAQDALSRARQRLANAVQHRDTAGRRAASHIRAATDQDGLKDSWWDKVKDWTSDRWDSFITWVHEHADLIRKIADIAGWIATALAAVAILISFIPVLDFLTGPLLALAALATVVSLVAHTMLALSGDGSWVDVGFDVIGLVTFGYGKIATKGIEASEQTVKVLATRAARKEAEKAIRKGLAETLETTGRPLTRAARQAVDSQVRQQATRAAKQAVKEATDVKSTVLDKVRNLDGAAAQAEARVRGLASLASRTPRIGEAGKAAVKALRKAAAVSGIGIGSDAIDKSGASDPIEPSFTFGRYASR
jgi:hypothetical protein